MARINLTAIVFALLTTLSSLVMASANPLFEMEDKRVMACPKSMACRWAICPWSRKPSGFYPDPGNCLFINNESCRCPPQHICTLTDLLEPSRAQLKFTYRCIAPELSREIYQMGKRSGANINQMVHPEQE